MGWGDDILSTAIARKAFAKVGKPVCIGDGTKAYWSPVFDNNPKIAKEPYAGVSWVRTYKGFRPYIEINEDERLIYKKDFKAEPGEIYFSDAERSLYADLGDFVLIEPNTKMFPLSKNKQWGIEKWQALVNAMPHIRWVQLKTGKYKLDNVEMHKTETIRMGFAFLNRASLFVGPDGGLHHACAALGKKAVVVWGGVASPKNLGYDTHINLHAGSAPCGSKMPCLHCKQQMDYITVPMMIEAVEKALDGNEHTKSTRQCADVTQAA